MILVRHALNIVLHALLRLYVILAKTGTNFTLMTLAVFDAPILVNNVNSHRLVLLVVQFAQSAINLIKKSRLTEELVGDVRLKIVRNVMLTLKFASSVLKTFRYRLQIKEFVNLSALTTVSIAKMVIVRPVN